jgi:hypothetical protein
LPFAELRFLFQARRGSRMIEAEERIDQRAKISRLTSCDVD